ncbi:Alpha/Beta hydrolase protein [Trichoderma longibrachiatum]|uniref:Alpha/beta-hydrolase n=1 Tax=Trichoderma longibrachiatum ATCC 18648 TaxID=983965 RepID=A0A2T4C9I4_TRILO|nr:alpha/beta-hydrolase [Trichoderma longibrachiatum ATCC 18648]
MGWATLGSFRLLLLVQLAAAFFVEAAYIGHQTPLGIKDDEPPAVSGISVSLFSTLERLARLVDVSYCLGNSGIRKPFECISRCDEFPNMMLVNTWSTGFLFGDNCGFIAVDQGSDQPRSDDGGDRQGAIVVAFRGTYSITNTIVDLSTLAQKYVPYPSPDHGGESPEKPSHECTNCTVHMGFLQSWQSARKAVLPELKALRAQYPSYPIHLVGHSLGGAVACLAALELKVSLGWDDVTVTTFGEPRAGNAQFARFVDDVFDLDGIIDLEARSYRRVTHADDPVPLLPPGELGYSSHSGEIFISKPALSPSETDVQLCIGDADPNCSAKDDSSVEGLLYRLLHFRSTTSSLEEYTQRMSFPARFKLWQLFFAHRDYFWRLGLCVPGGDPSNWGRPPYTYEPREEEL